MINVARDNNGGAQVDFALKAMKNQSNANGAQLLREQAVRFRPEQFAQPGPGCGRAATQRLPRFPSFRPRPKSRTAPIRSIFLQRFLCPVCFRRTLGITIGERPQSSPWIRFGEKGVEVYTAQTRVRLIAEVGGSGLLLGVRLRLPVYIDIAAARARLADISCGANPVNDMRVTLAVRPSLVNAWIAEPATLSGWKTLGSPPNMVNASIANALLVTATGKANAEITNMNDTNVVFRYADITSLTPKNVKTTDFTQSLTASLLSSLTLNVSVGPLSLLTPADTRPVDQNAASAGDEDGRWHLEQCAENARHRAWRSGCLGERCPLRWCGAGALKVDHFASSRATAPLASALSGCGRLLVPGSRKRLVIG